MNVLDAIYVDVSDGNATATIKPKAAFEAVLNTAGSYSLA